MKEFSKMSLAQLNKAKAWLKRLENDMKQGKKDYSIVVICDHLGDCLEHIKSEVINDD